MSSNKTFGQFVQKVEEALKADSCLSVLGAEKSRVPLKLKSLQFNNAIVLKDGKIVRLIVTGRFAGTTRGARVELSRKALESLGLKSIDFGLGSHTNGKGVTEHGMSMLVSPEALDGVLRHEVKKHLKDADKALANADKPKFKLPKLHRSDLFMEAGSVGI